MATSLLDIKYIVERDVQDQIEPISILNWANMAQNEFMLRIYIPDSTTLALNTTDVSYTLSTDIREIRRLRYQSDLDNNLNLSVSPVYKLYNGLFEVPYPFLKTDTLLIDYYRYLTFFTDATDEIDLDDRFFPLYTSYIEMRYHRLPNVIQSLGKPLAETKYQDSFNIYQSMKKQVASAYNLDIGVQKPKESGWGNK